MAKKKTNMKKSVIKNTTKSLTTKKTTIDSSLKTNTNKKNETIKRPKTDSQENKISIEGKTSQLKKKINSTVIVKCLLLILLQYILLFTIKRLATNQYDMAKNKNDNDKLIKEVLTPIPSPDDPDDGEQTSQSKTGYTKPYVKPGSVSVDFAKLKSINADTVGWIMFNGYVNNPVVKTVDNEYYLNHSFYRGVNEAGAIFMDYRNRSFEDKNVVIYGHATVDKSMFGTLSDVFTSSFWNIPDGDIIYIYNSNNQLIKYQIFSYYTIESEEYYITTAFKNDTAFQKFIDTIKGRSFSNRNVSVTTSDKILTLSTCAGSSGTNMRRVIHAKRI